MNEQKQYVCPWCGGKDVVEGIQSTYAKVQPNKALTIRSASGGCMAGRDHWRGKQCLKGFYIWLSRFGGAHRQPRSFSAIITSLIGIKLRR